MMITRKTTLFLACALFSSAVSAAAYRAPHWKSFKLGEDTYSTIYKAANRSDDYACRLKSQSVYDNNESQLVVFGPCLGSGPLETVLFNFNKDKVLTSVHAYYKLAEGTQDASELFETISNQLGGGFKEYNLAENGVSSKVWKKETPRINYEIKLTGSEYVVVENLRGSSETKGHVTDKTKAVASHIFNYEKNVSLLHDYAQAYSPSELIDITREDETGYHEITKNGCSVKGILRERHTNYIVMDSTQIFLSNMKMVKHFPLDRVGLLKLKDVSIDRGKIYATLVSPIEPAQATLSDRLEALDLLEARRIKEAEAKDPQVRHHYAVAKSAEGVLMQGPCFVPFQGGQPYNEKKCLEKIEDYFKSYDFYRTPTYRFFKRLSDAL